MATPDPSLTLGAEEMEAAKAREEEDESRRRRARLRESSILGDEERDEGKKKGLLGKELWDLSFFAPPFIEESMGIVGARSEREVKAQIS